MTTKEDAYKNYKDEAHKQFVTVFLDESPKMKEQITQALTVVLNLDEEPFKSGLMIHGESFGQGKTLFFEIVYNRVLRKTGIKIWKRTTAKELREVYTEKGQKGLLEFITCKSLFIDDLGDEEEKTKHFGDDMNVLRYVLLKRYEFWLEKGWLTHLTTNLNFEEIAERYSGRVADRLVQMTVAVKFDFINGSFRQVTSTRRLTEEEKVYDKVKPKTEQKDEAHYYKFLNELAEQLRADKMPETHWTDFWIMYNFLEEKGAKFRRANEEDRVLAKALLKADDLKNSGKGFISASQVKANTQKKNPLQVENAIKSIIAKEYFTKLAKRKFAFSETNNFSEL